MSQHRIRAVEIDGIPIDAVSLAQAVDLLAVWAADGTGGYVCTPNVDYIVKARRDPAFRAAVLGARMRVPDGMGIVYGSRIAGTPLPATVTGRLLPERVGAELTPRGGSIALFGGPPGVAEAAAAALRGRGVTVAGGFGPSIGFEIGSAEDALAVERLQKLDAAVIFVGLGAPKQELWMAAHTTEFPTTVLVGVGAAIEVLGGRRRAAPRWMTRVGLEWLFRLAAEPTRLARRYLWDDPRFFAWMVASRLAIR
jgi:N-acetylglucosaminyldiphosphoundecaprenol N-acetyl-beta-D-mannosaminyltransferase